MAARHKPPVSLWIAAERKRHGWKVEELSRRLREAGYPAEVSTVRVWEAGRSPAPDTLGALETLFGAPAPRDEPADQSDLVSVIRELVDEVRLSRLASDRNADVLAQLLGVVLAGRLPQSETEGADEPLVPLGNGQ
jgi:transcriptional regulator with XRE-family HTH domain